MVEGAQIVAGLRLPHDVQVGWISRKENAALAEWLDQGGACEWVYVNGGKVRAVSG